MAEKRFFACIFLLSLVFSVASFAQEDFEDLGDDVLEGEEEVLVEDRAGITPDSPLYVFDKMVDEVQLRTSKGEDKAKKALEIKEERIAEAAVMVNNSKADSAKDALELAAAASKIAQAEIAPDLEKETNEKVRKAATLLISIKDGLPAEGWEDIEEALETQLDEEEKTRIALIVSKSRLKYCDSLAKQDIDLMKSDSQCDTAKAPAWLKGKVEGEFTQRDEGARRQIFDAVSLCVLDPKQCDCSKIPVAKHIQTCELNKALAIRCDYEQDMEACDKLDESDEEFFDILGEEGARTVRELIKKKGGDFFDEQRPPECADAESFEDCFDTMTGLYGMPPFCKDVSKDECMKMIEENPELVKEDMPAECRDAGITNPRECARKMMHIYGSPPECKNIDVEDCIDLMMKKGPEHVGGPGKGMPPECEGINEPRQCFDIMNEKYGMPPFCSGMSVDECFEEMMKKEGHEEPPYPPECEEAGVTTPRGCHDLMNEKYGPPRFCEGMSADECFEETMRRGPEEPGFPEGCPECGPEGGDFYTYNPPECEAAGLTGPGTGFEGQKACSRLIMELYGMPEEFCPGMTIDECVEVMSSGEPKGGEKTMELCIGISPEECREIMKKEHGPPMECEGISQEDCVELMHKQGGVPGGVPLECAGLSPDGCERVMVKKYGPPECEGMTWAECEPVKQKLFSPPECEGMPQDECERSMMDKFGPSECSGMTKEECGAVLRDSNPECGGKSNEDCATMIMGRTPEPVFHEEVSDICGGVSRDECDSKMRQRFSPPECEGLDERACKELMSERERNWQQRSKGSEPQGYREPPQEGGFTDFDNRGEASYGGESGSGFNYGVYGGEPGYDDGQDYSDSGSTYYQGKSSGDSAYYPDSGYDKTYAVPEKKFDDSSGDGSYNGDSSGGDYYRQDDSSSYGKNYDSSSGSQDFYKSDEKGDGDVMHRDDSWQDVGVKEQEQRQEEPKSVEEFNEEDKSPAGETVLSEITGNLVAFAEWLRQ